MPLKQGLRFVFIGFFSFFPNPSFGGCDNLECLDNGYLVSTSACGKAGKTQESIAIRPYKQESEGHACHARQRGMDCQT